MTVDLKNLSIYEDKIKRFIIKLEMKSSVNNELQKIIEERLELFCKIL